MFSIICVKNSRAKLNSKLINVQVLVASGQKNMMRERMKLLNMLWENDVNAEMLYKANPKLLTQFQYAETESKLFLCSRL